MRSANSSGLEAGNTRTPRKPPATGKLTAMIHALALAQTAKQQQFNTAFYSVAASVIPVLFLAIAVQGTGYQDLLTAIDRAVQIFMSETADAIASLLASHDIEPPEDQGPWRMLRSSILVGREVSAHSARGLSAYMAAFLAVIAAALVVIFGAIGEVQAINALAAQKATYASRQLAVAGIYALLAAVGIYLLAVLLRSARRTANSLVTLIAESRKRHEAISLQPESQTTPNRAQHEPGNSIGAGEEQPEPTAKPQARLSHTARNPGIITRSRPQPKWAKRTQLRAKNAPDRRGR
jgi:hypothetical protein